MKKAQIVVFKVYVIWQVMFDILVSYVRFASFFFCKLVWIHVVFINTIQITDDYAYSAAYKHVPLDESCRFYKIKLSTTIYSINT